VVQPFFECRYFDIGRVISALRSTTTNVYIYTHYTTYIIVRQTTHGDIFFAGVLRMFGIPPVRRIQITINFSFPLGKNPYSGTGWLGMGGHIDVKCTLGENNVNGPDGRGRGREYDYYCYFYACT